jgi:1-acyl-sn-glycerol-3-phosphate acyltransferase
MVSANAVLRYPYPRRRLLRGLMSRLSRSAFSAISQLRIIGLENVPTEGPLIVVANHFSFLDPALMVAIAPWPLEFLGGFRMPNAPPVVTWIPKVWGYLPVFRGTGSRLALRAAESVLQQKGILGIYPEASSHVAMLRPARPGTAFLAARTQARILPMGFDGLPTLFSRLRHAQRQEVTVRIGQPFGPFAVTGRGCERRQQLNAIGHEIMERIAELIPPDKRGHYADDPAIRAAAQGTEAWHYDDEPEL